MVLVPRNNGVVAVNAQDAAQMGLAGVVGAAVGQQLGPQAGTLAAYITAQATPTRVRSVVARTVSAVRRNLPSKSRAALAFRNYFAPYPMAARRQIDRNVELFGTKFTGNPPLPVPFGSSRSSGQNTAFRRPSGRAYTDFNALVPRTVRFSGSSRRRTRRTRRTYRRRSRY